MEDTARQDDYLRSNIQNMVQLAENQYYPRFSAFLDERQQAIAEQVLRRLACANYLFYGGADHCDRLMLGVFPSDMEPDLILFPIVPLAARSLKESFSHRDCLGSLMGLGLKRASVGDIWVNGATAVLFLTEEVSGFVRSGLFRIGRIPVSVESPREDELFRTISYEERSGTVASLRLDCIAAFIMGKSRTQACSLIAAGLVSVNRVPVTQPAKQVAPGDQIVIRGFGKCYLGTQIRTTRKDRLSITIQKLV